MGFVGGRRGAEDVVEGVVHVGVVIMVVGLVLEGKIVGGENYCRDAKIAVYLIHRRSTRLQQSRLNVLLKERTQYSQELPR